VKEEKERLGRKVVSGMMLTLLSISMFTLLLNVEPVEAYKSGANATHRFIFDQAASILQNDGYVSYAEFLNSTEPYSGLTYLEIMKKASDENDNLYVGSFPFWDFHADVCCGNHYMDPLDHEGLLLGWPLGQFKSAGVLCQERFDAAVSFWQQGDFYNATYNLGWATHLVQDLCVPYHSILMWDWPLPNNHDNYETWVNSIITDPACAVHSGGIYSLPSFPDLQYYVPQHYNGVNSSAMDWVDYNAHESTKFFGCVNYETNVWKEYHCHLQTVKPLPIDTNTSCTLTYWMADKIKVHFEYLQVDLDDQIIISDNSNQTIITYTNINKTNEWTPEILGPNVHIRIVTDSLRPQNTWGYKLDRVQFHDIGDEFVVSTIALLYRAQWTTAGFIKFFLDKVTKATNGIFLSPNIIRWTTITNEVNDTFILEVGITNVTECYLIVFSVQWNESIIQLTKVVKGNVLEGTGITTQWLVATLPPSAGGPPSNPNSILGGVTYTRLGSVYGVNIQPPFSGLVATLTFKVVQEPHAGFPINTTISFIDNADYPTRWVSSPLAVPASTEYMFPIMSPSVFRFEAVYGEIFLSPSSISWTTITRKVNETFALEVRITNVTQCYLIVFSLHWDDTVILLDSVTQGNCLEPSTSFLIADLPVSAGGTGANDYLGGATYTRLGSVAGVTIQPPSSGLVATLTFKVIQEPPAGFPLSTAVCFLDTVYYPTRWTTSPKANPPSTEIEWATTSPSSFRFEGIYTTTTPIKAGGKTFNVAIKSNSSTTTPLFKAILTHGGFLIFNVTGASATAGFSNVTVPRNFMWNNIGESWQIMFDGLDVTSACTITQNATHTFIYIPYTHSPHIIEIIAPNAAALIGDINGDGRVNYKDLGILAVSYGSTPTRPYWNWFADLNNDGFVNYKDLGILAVNYGKTYP